MMKVKGLFFGSVILGICLFSAGAQAWVQDTFKRKVTVRPGATIVLAGAGQLPNQCELVPASSMTIHKEPKLGKLTSKVELTDIKPGEAYSVGCKDGFQRYYTYALYTAGPKRGSETVLFSITGSYTTLLYEITVEVK